VGSGSVPKPDAPVTAPVQDKGREALEKRLESLRAMQEQWLADFERARKSRNQSAMYHIRPNLAELRGRIDELSRALAELSEVR
jgi:hypothetical protein